MDIAEFVRKVCWFAVFAVFSMIAAAGCAVVPNRPYVSGIAADGACRQPPAPERRILSTPELSAAPAYVLHFLEFDDQGWLYADAGGEPGWRPESQIDCAIADLSQRIAAWREVRAFVYVHGWHHSSADDDHDLQKFRQLLALEAARSRREVIGFYIAWNANTWDLPGLRDATFWGRKNAAHHVAEGSVREFFARIKALRNYWNRPNTERARNCGKPGDDSKGQGCPLRTVMIGHSFGGWILYASVEPYLLETLAGSSDLPGDATLPVTARERGIADLVLLLNPAFEASRYDPVFRAARRYHPAQYEPPLLVSLTSIADQATGSAFPIARFFNSALQYPATSDEESEAIKKTHGHIDRYLTHELYFDPAAARDDCAPDAAMKDFFSSATRDGNLALPAHWRRQFCGGLTLASLAAPGADPYGIVWNIRTFANVIADHNDIANERVKNFVTQLYGDVGGSPRLPLAR